MLSGFITILTLILQNTLIAFSKHCPTGCMCISQKNAIPASYCDGFGFRTVPPNIARKTEILSLSMNTIHKLTDKNFEALTYLKRLNLKKNAIQSISESAFLKLNKLKSLNLGKNLLKKISTRTFENLVSLEELHLNDNQLEKLPKDLFTALPNLKKLHLQNNKLCEEEETILSNFKNLEYLDMSNNNLKIIRGRMFENLPKLRSVKLYDNKIETVDSDTFDSLPQLQEVMLNDNSIHTLDKNVFSNMSRLSKVTLYGNPLRCDCDLYWVYNALVLAPDMFQEKEKMKCHSPTKLIGKSLVDLLEESFGCDFSVWGSWGIWSACSRHCGKGTRSRKRSCLSASSTLYSCKGPREHSEVCNPDPCTAPLAHGLLTTWSQWTACPMNWKNSVRTRKRYCINPFTGERGQKEGAVCDEPLTETESCHGIPVNGGWSEWSPWSPCNKKCRVGTATRTRTCSNPMPQFNGALCDGLNIEKETKICLEALCPPRAYWSEWSEFSKCNPPCGKGMKLRRRYCLNEYNKRITIRNVCPGDDIELASCQNRGCVSDGQWSSWLQWSECEPLSCKRSRVRKCKSLENKDAIGHCPGKPIEKEHCDQRVCKINTVWTTWGKWTFCSKTCGGGSRNRKRECPGERNHPNIVCGEDSFETELCNVYSCISHTWSEWGAWSKCTKPISNKQVRKRKCIGEGPKQCKGRAKERRECRLRQVAIGDGVLINRKRKCRPRGHITNGVEKVMRTANGLEAEYTCNKFYRLKGGLSKATCIEGQGWSNDFVPYCIPNCGKSVHKSYNYWYNRARLFGGDVTVPHSWPWQAMLEVKTKIEGWKLRCGGSLINDRWIVTAAHCLFDKPPYQDIFRINEIKVYLGVHNLTLRKKSKDVQIFFAKNIIAHPDFDDKSFDNDIGLIELSDPAILSDKVLPVCLPTRKQKHLAGVGKIGTVVGWGGTRNQRASINLKELQLPVIQYTDCVNAYSKKYTLTASMFCAGKKTFEDTCQGDSGGGFLFQDPRKNKWTLQGVVSWGGRKCGNPDQPSVYTKVSQFTNWIRKVMRDTNNLLDGHQKDLE